MQRQSVTISHHHTDAVSPQASAALEKLPPDFIADHDVTGVEYLFGQLDSAVPAASPPSLSLIFWGYRVRTEPLMLGQPCWAMCRTLLCRQHYFSHKSYTQYQTGCCEENWLCPSQTVHPRAWWEALESKFRFEPLTRTHRWGTSLLLEAPFAVSALWGLGWCCVHWSACLGLIWVRASHWSLRDCCCPQAYISLLDTCNLHDRHLLSLR